MASCSFDSTAVAASRPSLSGLRRLLAAAAAEEASPPTYKDYAHNLPREGVLAPTADNLAAFTSSNGPVGRDDRGNHPPSHFYATPIGAAAPLAVAAVAPLSLRPAAAPPVAWGQPVPPNRNHRRTTSSLPPSAANAPTAANGAVAEAPLSPTSTSSSPPSPWDAGSPPPVPSPLPVEDCYEPLVSGAGGDDEEEAYRDWHDRGEDERGITSHEGVPAARCPRTSSLAGDATLPLPPRGPLAAFDQASPRGSGILQKGRDDSSAQHQEHHLQQHISMVDHGAIVFIAVEGGSRRQTQEKQQLEEQQMEEQQATIGDVRGEGKNAPPAVSIAADPSSMGACEDVLKGDGGQSAMEDEKGEGDREGRKDGSSLSEAGLDAAMQRLEAELGLSPRRPSDNGKRPPLRSIHLPPSRFHHQQVAVQAATTDMNVTSPLTARGPPSSCGSQRAIAATSPSQLQHAYPSRRASGSVSGPQPAAASGASVSGARHPPLPPSAPGHHHR